MDISRYTKLIDKIARNLKSGKLMPENIGDFAEKELGYKLDPDDNTNFKSIDQMEIEQQQHKFFRDNYTLIEIFKTILEIYHKSINEKDLFSVKYNAFKLVEKYRELNRFKESVNYEKVLLFTISDLKTHFPVITVTPDMIKILKKDYLPKFD